MIGNLLRWLNLLNWYAITAVTCILWLALVGHVSGDYTPLMMTLGIVSAIWAMQGKIRIR